MSADAAPGTPWAASRGAAATIAFPMPQGWPPGPIHPRLCHAEVHVHRCSLRSDEGATTRLAPILSAAELERAGRFRLPHDARRWVVGRATLRHILARYVGDEPARLRLSEGPHGKPFLEERRPVGQPVHFNVSHCEDVLLVAVSRGGPVGVDLERVRAFPELLAVARDHLPSDEHAVLEGLPERERVELFFRFWTRAEALQKATGCGIGGAAAADSARHASYSVIELRPAPGHIAALAHLGGHGPVRLWSLGGRM